MFMGIVSILLGVIGVKYGLALIAAGVTAVAIALGLKKRS